MNKTLHSTFTPSTYKLQGTDSAADSTTRALEQLSVEMKPYLQNAAKDLLTPRPQAIAALLRSLKN